MNLKLGTTPVHTPLTLDLEALRTHAVVLGTTGSGKTGMLVGLAEELAMSKVPTVLIDIKGDLANIALQTDPAVAEKLAVRLLTPGAEFGQSINAFSNLNDMSKLTQTVTSILKMVNVESDPIKSSMHSFVSMLIKANAKSRRFSLVDLIEEIQEPPFNVMGAMDLDDVVSPRSRRDLAAKLNNLLVSPSFSAWRKGIALSLEALTAQRRDGRTPVTVFSVAHLVDDSERNFAISMFLDELLSWTRSLEGTDDLRCAVIIDECYGLMPPAPANPATKKPILTMLKQARAFGVGMILATQNPMDVDYKGMSNCETWIVGRLQTANDRRRVVEAVSSLGYDRKEIEDKIGSLQKRQFLLARPKGATVFNSRTVSAQLTGPLTEAYVNKMYAAELLVRDKC